MLKIQGNNSYYQIFSMTVLQFIIIIYTYTNKWENTIQSMKMNNQGKMDAHNVLPPLIETVDQQLPHLWGFHSTLA